MFSDSHGVLERLKRSEIQPRRRGFQAVLESATVEGIHICNGKVSEYAPLPPQPCTATEARSLVFLNVRSRKDDSLILSKKGKVLEDYNT